MFFAIDIAVVSDDHDHDDESETDIPTSIKRKMKKSKQKTASKITGKKAKTGKGVTPTKVALFLL